MTLAHTLRTTGSSLLIILTAASFTACATRYSLEPTNKDVKYLNGIPMETLTLPKCVVQAGFQASTKEEMLIRVKILNKSDRSIEWNPTAFSLVGAPEVLKNSPLQAREPESYVKELNASAELFEARAKMESYQGIDDLASLKTAGSDAELEAAKQQYNRQKEEAKDAEKTAADLRARAALIQTSALHKGTVKSGESFESAVVFKSAFVENGPLSLVLDHPICGGKMNFTLSK